MEWINANDGLKFEYIDEDTTYGWIQLASDLRWDAIVNLDNQTKLVGTYSDPSIAKQAVMEAHNPYTKHGGSKL